jgi:hypothetical protein
MGLASASLSQLEETSPFAPGFDKLTPRSLVTGFNFALNSIS